MSDQNIATPTTKSLTQNGLNGPNALLILLSLGIIGVSTYLTAHYFEAYFPTRLDQGSLCNLSSFWNCDHSTFSPMSNIFTIPISFFSLLFGCFLLLGSIFPGEKVERTNAFLSLINIAGCLVLFAYSIVALDGLCPMCVAYYLLSSAVAFLFFRYSDGFKMPAPQVLGLYLLPALVGSYFLGSHYSNQQTKVDQLSSSTVEQYKKLANLGDPETESPMKIMMSTDKFSEAPIRLTIFSDFQCPACKALSELLPMMESRYQGKMNIQYIPYPLDDSCNPNMKNPLHPLACKAAYIAYCAADKFGPAHDEIFENQHALTHKWLNELALKYGVTDCMNDPATKEAIVAGIKAGEKYNLRSTPTLLVNGVKIEGAIPLAMFQAIFDYLVKSHE